MGRKKVPGANEAPEVAEATPFCYYCDREFNDVKTLIHHQRTKHFCCGECGRTFGSVTSLRVHMLNSYKKSLKEVPHAMSGRENPDVVVHGMEGLPQGILEERMQKSKADADEKCEEEKELPKGAPKGGPSSPATKTVPTTIPSTSPEPQSEQKQAASPETGHKGRGDALLPNKLEEDVDAALACLPPALKLLVPELLEDTPQCEGLPDALASLHSIAVQALASCGLLHPGGYGADKMDAALQAAVAAVKPKVQVTQGQPVMPDVPNTAPGPTMTLPMGFVQATMVAGPLTASQPLRPLSPAPMACFPAGQFPPMQGRTMAAMQNLGPGRAPAAPNTSQTHPTGYVPAPQGMACGGCATAQPMQLPFGVPMAVGALPTVGGRQQIGGQPTMPPLPTQLPASGIVAMEPAEKRAKLDVA